LIITTPIPDGPGFPRLAPSILIVNNSLTKIACPIYYP
jgi:hypothetical protein